MSSAKSQRKFETKLRALQCHFTWALDPHNSKLLRLKEKVADIGTDRGNPWLGHIYNLQGFIECKLEKNEDAKSLFKKAEEAFRQLRKEDEGPWLMVNYGNLAWLHHQMGGQAESQSYLSKVEALLKKYPPPTKGELHAEIYAEKAWTLMKFGASKQVLAAECFEKAISMQPDQVDWNTSYVLGLAGAQKHNEEGVETDVLEKMELAKKKDPKNSYLAAVYLMQLGKKGQNIAEEARVLGRQILKNPISSYSGIKPFLGAYAHYVSVDEALDLAEEALRKHPEERFLKRCLALCYKWKIVFFFRQSRRRPNMFEKAISLHREVISLYPNTNFVEKIDLANVYAKSSTDKAKAELIYQKLLRRDYEPTEKQVLYNQFAKHLYHNRQDHQGSMQFHMRAASIPVQSFYRDDSVKALKKTRDTTTWSRKRKDIEDFLAKLQL